MYASSRGHTETVRTHDATVNTQDKYDITALMIATNLCFLKIIVHLLLNY